MPLSNNNVGGLPSPYRTSATMLIARPCSATSKASLRRLRVTNTATSTRPTASRSWATTMVIKSRRCIEISAISGTQHVTLPAQGMDQLVLSALQLSPQPGDINLDDIAEALPIEIVEVFEELGFRHYRSGSVGQVFQNPVFHCREHDNLATAAHGKSRGVDFDIADLQHGIAVSLAPADQCLGSCQQFTQVEGFGHIVIGPCVQQRHDGLLFVPCRE